MSIKTRAALQTEKDNTFTTNNNQEITGETHRAYEANSLDSYYNKLDESWLASSIYSITKSYVAGDLISISGRVLVCSSATSGVYDPTKWDDVKNVQTGSALLGTMARAANSSLAAFEGTTVSVTGTTGVIDLIANGVHGRTYRFIPVSGVIATFSHTAVATAIVNGTGQIGLVGGNLAIIGRASLEGSDFIDLRCHNALSLEYWTLENYKIIS